MSSNNINNIQSEEFDIKSLFLGSQSENSDLLKELVNMTLNSIIETRAKVNEKFDEPIFSKDYTQSDNYITSKLQIIQKTNEMLEYLKGSIQFSSFRTMSYMFGDTTIPSIIGNIATLFYNQTNLIYQLSNTTTPLEYIVVKDLIKLIGFPSCNERVICFDPMSNERLIEFQNNEALESTINAFGHLTSGGSISNIEAFWSSYLNKFLAISIKQALLKENQLLNSRNILIKSKFIYSKDYIELNNNNSGGNNTNSGDDNLVQLVSLSNWDLLNIDIDQIVRLPFQIANENQMKYYQVIDLIKRYHPVNIGIHSFINKHKLNLPIFIVPKSSHYSFSKASSVLGLGIEKGIQFIDLDLKNRMSIPHLKRILKDCYRKRIPVLNVSCLLGSTVEGAIDPIDKVLELREKYRSEKKMDWSIHADGAYGALFFTCIRDDFPIDLLPNKETNCIINSNIESLLNNIKKQQQQQELFEPDLIINEYLAKQFDCLKYCESITLDYHKHGFVNFAAGGILFRNEKFKHLLSMVAGYIDYYSIENLGTFGLEGSRNGQSAAAIYLSNSIIRPSSSGFGKLISLSLLNSKLFYLGLLCLNELESCNFKVVTLSKSIQNKRLFKYLVNKIFNITNFQNINDLIFPNINDIKWDSKLIKLLSSIGPDLNVICFTVNPKSNLDYQEYLNYMARIGSRFSIKNAPNIDLLLSSPSINDTLNLNLTLQLLKSLSIVSSIPSKNITIPFLRSITIDPFSTQTINTSVYTNIFKLLKSQLNELI